MSEQYKSLHPIKYYRDHLSHKIRPDGREFEKFRPTTINLGSITTADGSALVKIGNTTVICGIKAELCQPKSEHPQDGFLIPNVELPPLCSPKFRPGPPTEQAQALSQLLSDLLTNTNCLDLKELCIYQDKLVWCLYADLICLDYDGTIIDACVAALIAALKTVTLPKVDYDVELDIKQVHIEDRKPLQVLNMPVATSFCCFDDVILADPTLEEENLCTGQISIVVKNNELCFIHKPGGVVISDEQLFKCIEESKKRTKIIEQLINKALESL